MSNPRVVIVGGGLAGLSAGCYARVNDFDVTIVEHNLALGGVCTAWQRGAYLVDGCIHWLTGGPFMQIYEELGIIPPVEVRPLTEFATYRHALDKWSVSIRRNLAETADALRRLAPEDADEIARLFEAADHVTTNAFHCRRGGSSRRHSARTCACVDYRDLRQTGLSDIHRAGTSSRRYVERRYL